MKTQSSRNARKSRPSAGSGARRGKDRLVRQLWIPDTHVPNEDKRAVDLVEQVAKGLGQFDEIIISGDFGDFETVSAHANADPRKERLLLKEVAQVRAAIRRVETWGKPKARRVYVCGNHEWRLDRYIANEAPALFGTVDVPSILELGDRWEFVPYKEHIQIGKVYATHDTGKAGQNAHLAAQADFQDNVVIGHTHRLAYAVVGNAKGNPHVAAMFGWLGDRDKADYMHTIKARRDWALGFGIGYRTASGVTYLQPVPIVNYTCVVEGKLYRA
jgi:predicted phosphodiesterase